MEISSQYCDLDDEKFFFSFFRDITKQKQTDDEIRKADIYLNAMGDALIVLDIERNVIKLNTVAMNLFGYSQKEIPGLTFEQLFPEKEHVKHYKKMKTVIEGSKLKPFETFGITKDGKEIPILLSGTTIKNSAGENMGFVGVCKDITERKQAENALKESEEKFRNIFDNANIIIWGTYADGKIKIFNKEAERVIGYSQEEALGMINMSLHPPEEREEIIEKFKRHKEGVLKKDLELGIYTKDGKRLKVLLAQATFKDADG